MLTRNWSKLKKKKMSCEIARLHHGIGARCSVLRKFLHPAALVETIIPNNVHGVRVSELLTIRQEVRKVNRKDQMCLVFRHPALDNEELHAVKRWVRIDSQGHPDHFFEPLDLPVDLNQNVEPIDVPEVPTIVGENDSSRIRALGFEVDDDDEPAAENLLPANPNEVTYGQWGWNGIDARAAQNHYQMGAHMKGFATREICEFSILEWFLRFLPRQYVQDVLIPETNKSLEDTDMPLTFGEFLRWLGLWLLMSTVSGIPREDFWATSDISMFYGAPFRFNKIMSKRRFNAILSSLNYTNVPFPTFKDKFHEVRQVLDAFNERMTEIFSPAWVSCLDESMSVWTSKWTCPGWIYVPRKPHPMGNEYHTICCGKTRILYQLELVEGKERPAELGPRPYENLGGKTVGLLLRLTRPIHTTGRCVILDSGFCVLKGLVELRKVGVFASALIKKRRYWPRYVDGNAINSHMAGKPLGAVDALPGIMDNVPFNIFVMRDVDYNSMLMSTYGGLTIKPAQSDTMRTVRAGDEKTTKTFKYHQPFADYYIYRHVVDDHNNYRHDAGTKCGLSLETTWVTHRWANRVFAFIMGICEVNAYLAIKSFDHWDESFLSFRKKLAKSLIDNPFYVRELRETRRSRGRENEVPSHEHRSAPVFARRWTGESWDTSSKTKYPQYHCKTPGCRNRVRTYCSCDRGTWMCRTCYIEHVQDVARST